MDGFDPHVVVHSFLHEGSFSKTFTFFGNLKCVKLLQFGQMEKHVSLVVAKAADWVFAIMRVDKISATQVREYV